MRSGRLHIAGFNTGSNPLAVNCAGFVPFTIMASLDGHFGYEMEIITYPGSGIDKVEDIKGRNLAFTSPTSNSGFKAPSAILKAEFDMLPERDFEPSFSGKHDNSILGVANKDYDAASIANSVKSRMISRDVIKAEDVITIYKSQTFPTTGFGHAHNLKPDLAKKVQEAFSSFPWDKPDGTPTSLSGVREIQRGPVHSNHLPGALGCDPYDRQGQQRLLRLQVTFPRLLLRGRAPLQIFHA
jgi:phosphonate transport system substrate-binding protein